MLRLPFVLVAAVAVVACAESTPAPPSAPPTASSSGEAPPSPSNNYGMPSSPPPDIQLSSENGTAMVDFGEVLVSSPTVQEKRVTPGLTAGDYPADARGVAEKQILPKVFKCYTQALGLEGKQAGQGRVHLVLQVAPAGDVTGVEVASNSGLSPKVAECTSAAAKTAHFMSTSQGGTVKIPFIFAVQR
jgi:hypothetical protein